MTQKTETCTLVALKLSAWSARKFDAGASSNVTRATHAAKGAARVNKLLVSKRWLAPIQNIDNAIRAKFYEMTLAYPVTSIRVLPESIREAFEAEMAGLFGERTTRIETALAQYEAEREKSRKRLGAMFNPADYPTRDEIEGKYAAYLTVLPMPAGWKAGIEDDTLADQLDAARTDGMAEAYRDVWARIADCARNMTEKLGSYTPGKDGDKPKNIFRDSLVTNAQGLIVTLESMVGIFDDDELGEALALLKTELGEISPEVLRGDDRKRAQVTNVAKSVLDKALSALGEPAPVVDDPRHTDPAPIDNGPMPTPDHPPMSEEDMDASETRFADDDDEEKPADLDIDMSGFDDDAVGEPADEPVDLDIDALLSD